jgi:hypothetical protein
MVFLRLKNSENNQFIFETKSDIMIDIVIRDLVRVHNLRVKLNALIPEVEELIKYGVMKEPEKQGIDEEMIEELNIEEIKDKNQEKKVESRTNDPTHRRMGNPPTDERVLSTIRKTIEEAKYYISKEYTAQKKCLTEQGLRDLIDSLSGAIKIAYPMGLPEYDSISRILDPEFIHNEYFDEEKSSLWFAGKQLHRDQRLQDNKSIGRNEKTMIIVKITKKGSGAPAREPPLNEEMQKKLMAYYYKKQEEEKKLLEDEDDSYVNSSWSNPKMLKNHFQGINDDKISWN